ncbi:carbohydrate kinase [Loktanella sp. IMCC34160]|uniref:carbohydrate kinase family protein n=1 Tax=Loktanella sp. IMCC34160 TaxID=2510646 RepID=UPI00101BA891|nr:carbohydrate kinase [Loktanella sp. IMCC34160]RYG93248.1 carbohydrate kinase [Loktanella sp. IMCC34160]
MILACGEALIDMLPRESTAGEPAFAPYAGGAVFNTAIALGRLGVPTGFLSGVSTDLFGQQLLASLEASKVGTGHLIRSDRPTTLAFVTLTNGHAKYAFYDENTAGRMLRPDDLPDTSVSAYFFGGISLVVEPCGQAYEALARRVAGTAPVMVDPNIRPGFIKDEAAYRERLNVMFACADIIKVSDEDLEWITGSTDGEAFRDSCAASVVLVTRGADGVTVICDHGTFDVPATRVEVVDTVGAGDTFNAGFLAGLHQAGALTLDGLDDADEATLRAAVELGAKAAAVTVSRAGANPPWASEL